jgi:hypothetical protein
VELTGRVRWQRKRIEFTNAVGKKQISDSQVYQDRDDAVPFELSARIFEGSLSDLTAGEIADPKLVNDSYRLKKLGVTPSVRNNQGLTEAIL